MSQITLEYTAKVGVQPAAVIAAKLGAIPIYEGELSMLGMFKVTDSAAVVSGEAVRTIVLETTAEGDANWPTPASLVYATMNLYKQALAFKLPGKITAAVPVVS